MLLAGRYFVVLSLLATFAAPVAAQTPAVDTVEGRYAEGKAALEAGQFEAAATAFSTALASVDDEVMRWQLLLGLALTEEARSMPVEAMTHYRAFISRAESSPRARSEKWRARLKLARQSVTTLEADVLQDRGALQVSSPHPHVSVVLVTVTGEVPLQLPATTYLPPGSYVIRGSAVGRTTFTQPVTLAVGDRVSVDVDPPLLQRPPTPPDPTVPTPVSTPLPVEEAGLHPGWIPVAAGGALLVTGGVLTALALSDAGDVDRLANGPATDATLAEHDRLTARGESRQTWSWVAYGVGLGTIASGVIWMALDDAPPTRQDTHTLRLDVEARPGWTGVSLRGGF